MKRRVLLAAGGTLAAVVACGNENSGSYEQVSPTYVPMNTWEEIHAREQVLEREFLKLCQLAVQCGVQWPLLNQDNKPTVAYRLSINSSAELLAFQYLDGTPNRSSTRADVPVPGANGSIDGDDSYMLTRRNQQYYGFVGRPSWRVEDIPDLEKNLPQIRESFAEGCAEKE